MRLGEPDRGYHEAAYNRIMENRTVSEDEGRKNG